MRVVIVAGSVAAAVVLAAVTWGVVADDGSGGESRTPASEQRGQHQPDEQHGQHGEHDQHGEHGQHGPQEQPVPEESEKPEDKRYPNALPATVATAAEILPDGQAIEASIFEAPGSSLTSGGFCDSFPTLCATVQATSDVRFLTGDEKQTATFHLLAHASEGDARQTLELTSLQLGAQANYVQADLAPVGDDSTALQLQGEEGILAYVTLIRVGPYVGMVGHNGGQPQSAQAGPATMDGLNAMFAARMAQAAAGEQPTAVVE